MPRSKRTSSSRVAKALRFGQAIYKSGAKRYQQARKVARVATAAHAAVQEVNQQYRNLNRSQRVSRFKFSGTGKYAGKFKKAKRVPRRDPYNYYGFSHTQEIVGTVADTDCVYIGHSAISGAHTLDIINKALLKKLFTDHGHQVITDVNQELVAVATTGLDSTSLGYFLRLVYKNMRTGVVAFTEYPVIAGESIATIVGNQSMGVTGTWANLRNFSIDYLTGSDLNDTGIRLLQKLQLFVREIDTVTDVATFKGEIRYDQMKIHFQVHSELKIQNRTASNSGDMDADNVGNNPLEGRSYQFNSGAPRWRVDGPFLLGRMPDYTGVITQVANFMSGTDATTYKEPPNPRVFQNCVKSAKVRLEPGHIKSDHLKWSKSMPLYKFFDRMGWRRSTAFLENGLTQPQSVQIAGVSRMYALEDTINVNLTQAIACAYEVNRVTSVYFTTMPHSPSVGNYSTLTQNCNFVAV